MLNRVLKMSLRSAEWAIPEKLKQWGLRIYCSEKKSWNFWIFHLTLRNSGKSKLSPLEILQKLCNNP